jgi:hypothetical protein
VWSEERGARSEVRGLNMTAVAPAPRCSGVRPHESSPAVGACKERRTANRGMANVEAKGALRGASELGGYMQ